MSQDDRHPELRGATVAEIRSRELPRLDSVTAVIEQRVRPESVEAYEQWLREVIPIAARFPGHRGVNVIHPQAGGVTYTVMIRFDSLAHAEDWFKSDSRHELLAQVAPLLEGEEKVKTVTGLEFWFNVPEGGRPVPRYKQFVLTLAGIYPLSLVVPAALRTWTAGTPLFGNSLVEHFVSSVVIVALMAYVVMPRITRLMSRWLHA